MVFAARKLRLVISFDITNATTLRWRRSFHASLAPKNTIREQDWKITSKENIKTSSLPFPSFVMSVPRLLKQKVECLNTTKLAFMKHTSALHRELKCDKCPKNLGSRRTLKEHKKRKHVNVEPVQVVGVAQGENTI